MRIPSSRAVRGLFVVLLACASACLVAPAAVAQDCSDFENLIHYVGSLPPVGRTLGVTASDDDLFIMLDGAAGARIFRMVPQQGPEQTATIAALDSLRHAVFLGTDLYVADGSRIIVYDLSDPTAPAQLGALDFRGNEIRKLAIWDNLLVAARGVDGLSLLDCSDPSALDYLVTLPMPGAGALDVAVRDNIVAVATGDTLFTFDCSDPASPLSGASLALPGQASLVTWDGDWAATAGTASGVPIVDMSDPLAPNPLVTLAYPSPRALFASGDLLYASADYFTVTDLGDPSSPERLGTTHLPSRQYTFPDRGGLEMALLGATLLVADGPAGGHGFEPGDAPPASLLSACGPVLEIVDFAFCGDLAVVAPSAFGPVRLFDISDPTTPVGRGSIPPVGWFVAARDPYVYLVSSSAVTVYDVTDPDVPVLTGSCDLGLAPPASCTLSGNYLYIAAAELGVIPVDVSDPAHPVALPAFFLAQGAEHLAFIAQTAFVIAGTSLSSVDFHDPANPVVLDTVACPDVTRGVTAFNGLVYVAAGAAGVTVFDAGDPADLSLRMTLPVATSATGIASAGGWLYILDEQAGLLVADGRWNDNFGIRGQVFDTAANALCVRTGSDLVGVLSLTHLQLAAPGCDGITPTFLAAFTAVANPAGTTLNWRASLGAGGEFRLSARLGARSWDVPWQSLGGEEFGATDVSPELAAGGTAVYTLWYREPGDIAWQVLAVNSVALPAPRTVLLAPYPNPFNPRTTVVFTLARAGAARVTVHDAAGRRVATLVDGACAAGRTELVWNGRDVRGQQVASGTYFVRLETDDVHSAQRLTLVR